MKLQIGTAPQLNSKAGTTGLKRRRRAVHAAEDVELVMMQVNRHRVVGLKGRPLRP